MKPALVMKVVAMGELVISGLEWDGLCKLLSTTLRWDNVFRGNIKKTLLFKRDWTEAALKELEKAGKRAKLWILYVEMSWEDPPMKRTRYIMTKHPDRFKRLLASNERLLACVPKRVTLKTSTEVLLGIANACCKLLGLNEALTKSGEGAILSEAGCAFARRFWKRCHLFWRRSVGAKKAAWRRKGYIAEFEDVPDFRDEEYHEGAQLLYDVEKPKSTTTV